MKNPIRVTMTSVGVFPCPPPGSGQEDTKEGLTPDTVLFLWRHLGTWSAIVLLFTIYHGYGN